MIEIKKRELESRIYFAMKAAIQGYSVCIGKKSSFYYYRKIAEKGIVILKSIGVDNAKIINQANQNGHIPCAWDEEGMTFFEKEYNDRRLDIENLRNLRLFFTWGNIDTKIINHYYPDQAEKIHRTGNSRIDVLKNPYNELYASEAKLIKKKYGNFFLFPTLFTQCNSANLYNSDYVTSLIKQGYKPNSPCVIIGKSLTVQQENILEETKVFFKKFNEECPDKKLIVRPHPSEKIQFWFDLCKNYKNIDVIFDDQSTCSWIKASDMLISTNCTTSIEALFLNKKSVNFLPYKDETVEYTLPKETSVVVRSTKELIDIIKNNLNDDIFIMDEKKKQQVKNWLFNAFEGCGAENIIEVLKKKIPNLNDNKNKTKDKYTNKISFMFFVLFRKLRLKLNLLFATDAYKLKYELTLQKFPSLTLKEIQEKILFFSKFMDNTKFQVTEKYPGLFSIERKN